MWVRSFIGLATILSYIAETDSMLCYQPCLVSVIDHYKLPLQSIIYCNQWPIVNGTKRLSMDGDLS